MHLMFTEKKQIIDDYYIMNVKGIKISRRKLIYPPRVLHEHPRVF